MHIVSEPMTGASSVWNAMLSVWNEVKLQPGWDPTAVSPMLGIERLPDQGRRARRPAAPPAAGATVPHRRRRHRRGDRRSRAACSTRPAAARRSRSLLKLDGLLGCALVDAATGLVLAHETRDRAVARHGARGRRRARRCCAPIATRRAAWGSRDPIDEVITTAGSRHVLIRALQRHAELFLVALLEKHRTNLALARFQLLEVERSLP